MSGLDAFYRRLATRGPSSSAEQFLHLLLIPLGWIYGLGARLRALFYRRGWLSSYRAPVPVVSVGNLSLGGTGKTPVVDAVVRYFQAQGRRVAIVSRGYGGSAGARVEVVSRGAGPLTTAEVCGDEPLLLARRNPQAIVVVARRRAEGIRVALEQCAAQLVVLDDGFQHLAVQRDLDIVLLDAERPLGNGHVFPAGLLRESPGALQRGDLFLMTRCRQDRCSPPDLAEGALCCRHVPDDCLVDLEGRQVERSALAGRKGLAFAGIAEPASFFDDLERSGLRLSGRMALPDHCRYDGGVLARLREACREADFLVTTEKDGVKLRPEDFPVPCYQVPLTLEFDPPGALERALEEKFSARLQ